MLGELMSISGATVQPVAWGPGEELLPGGVEGESLSGYVIDSLAGE